jgi:hypothetical protein
MKDKIGQEIEVGDVLACINMDRVATPPYLAVVTGFTPQKIRVAFLYLWANKTNIQNGNDNSMNFVKLNDEQIESLIPIIHNFKREYDYQRDIGEEIETLEEFRNVVNDLLEISRNLKQG